MTRFLHRWCILYPLKHQHFIQVQSPGIDKPPHVSNISGCTPAIFKDWSTTDQAPKSRDVTHSLSFVLRFVFFNAWKPFQKTLNLPGDGSKNGAYALANIQKTVDNYQVLWIISGLHNGWHCLIVLNRVYYQFATGNYEVLGVDQRTFGHFP